MRTGHLNDGDFHNDRKDAGDRGHGHIVTSLYEIISVGVHRDFYAIDDLKYQPSRSIRPTEDTCDWLTTKLRCKYPEITKATCSNI